MAVEFTDLEAGISLTVTEVGPRRWPWSCIRRRSLAASDASMTPHSTVASCGRYGGDRRVCGRKVRSFGRRNWRFGKWNLAFGKFGRKQEEIIKAYVEEFGSVYFENQMEKFQVYPRSGEGRDCAGLAAFTNGVEQVDDRGGGDQCALAAVVTNVCNEGGGGSMEREEAKPGAISSSGMESPRIEPTEASPVEPKGGRKLEPKGTPCPMLELMPPSLRPPITCPNPECGLVMSRDGVKEPLNYCPLCGAMLPQGSA